MKIQRGEQQAICAVLQYGAEYGYGNLISHLQTAWAKSIMRDGLSESAVRSVVGPGYPFAVQEDLIENGEWDETGERYGEDL